MSPSLAPVKCQSGGVRLCMRVCANQTYLRSFGHAGIDQSLSIRHQRSINDGEGEERPSQHALVSGQGRFFFFTSVFV